MKESEWIHLFKEKNGREPSKEEVETAIKNGLIFSDNTNNGVSGYSNFTAFLNNQASKKRKIKFIIGIVSIIIILVAILGTFFTVNYIGNKSVNREKVSKFESKSESKSKPKITTKSFFAPGKYIEGEDIQAGSYYFVMTDIQYSSNDSKKEAYLTLEILDAVGDSTGTFEMVYTIGKVYKVTIPKGATIILDDGYSPDSWNVTFYTPNDYEKDKDSINKSHSSSSESKSSTSQSSSSTNSSTSSSSESSLPSTSSSNSSTKPILISASELTAKYDAGELKDGEVYQFTTSPIWTDIWGMNADNTKYLIYVNSGNPENEDLMLYCTKSLADSIKTASSISVTIKVSNVEKTGGDLTVITATPN